MSDEPKPALESQPRFGGSAKDAIERAKEGEVRMEELPPEQLFRVHLLYLNGERATHDRVVRHPDGNTVAAIQKGLSERSGLYALKLESGAFVLVRTDQVVEATIAPLD